MAKSTGQREAEWEKKVAKSEAVANVSHPINCRCHRVEKGLKR